MSTAIGNRPVNVDNVTLQNVGGQISVKDGGVDTAQLADKAVSLQKMTIANENVKTTYIISSEDYYTNDLSKPVPSTSWTKLMETKIDATIPANTLMRFQVTGSNVSSGNILVRIYKNGVAVGEEHMLVSGSPPFTEDIIINPEDLIQIYSKLSLSYTTGTIQNMKILGDGIANGNEFYGNNDTSINGIGASGTNQSELKYTSFEGFQKIVV